MKYKKGEFGYWWTVIKGNKDIKGKVYVGIISCRCSGLVSLKGAPEKVGGYFNCSGSPQLKELLDKMPTQAIRGA